jgi:hypothetical protein
VRWQTAKIASISVRGKFSTTFYVEPLKKKTKIVPRGVRSDDHYHSQLVPSTLLLLFVAGNTKTTMAGTITARSGYAKGTNAGHVTQQRALKPKPSNRKGVSDFAGGIERRLV